MKSYFILRGIKMFIFFMGFVALAGLAVMYLWNWLMPEIFGLSAITWVQSLGLLALSRILFGGRGGWGKGRGGHKFKRKQWRKRWMERYEQMSPEEKAQFKQRFGNRCGDWKTEKSASYSGSQTETKESGTRKDPFTDTDIQVS